LKQCTKCKITYPVSNFHKDRTHKDNLRSVCKDCRREYMKYFRQQRLKHGLCYDCGKTRPEGHIRFCPNCLKKREKLNKIYEQQRKTKGLCRQCGKKPIDYIRSGLHCSSCLDLRNYNKRHYKERCDPHCVMAYTNTCEYLKEMNKIWNIVGYQD